MKRALFTFGLAAALGACTSIEHAVIPSSDIAAHGDAVAIIQVSSLGLTALFHNVDIVPSNLDQVVNKLLVTEAKSMGANKVDLKSAQTTPRGGIYMLSGFLIGVTSSSAVGLAVK